MRIELKRKNDKYHYEARNAQGRTVEMDGAPDIGGSDLGARPMELLLMALGGCTSIDIGMILGKQRLVVDDVRLVIDGHRNKEAVPALFEQIHVAVYVDGDLPAEKVQRAVDLSLTKYCSVAKTLERTAAITYTIYLNNEKL